MAPNAAEARILDAAKHCFEQWGIAKVTIEDIAAAAGVSRATLYRLFPGGKEILYSALQVRELTEFFDRLTAEAAGVDDFEDLVVRLIVTATRELRADQHLAIMLGSEPGEVLSQLTVEGLPRTIRVATEYLTPLVLPYLSQSEAATAIDLLVRLTISYFLAPSDTIDLGDPDSARQFIQPGLAALAFARTT
jgi:AcrR family transcriptional regulator